MQPVRSATGEGAGEPPDARTDAGRPRPRGSTVAWLVVGGIGGALVALAVVLAAGLLLTSPETASLAPHFVEEATAAGVQHVYGGPFPYVVGGGVATFDCNGDRLPDLYFAGGSNPAALYRNESPLGGALRFTQVPDPVTDLASVTGAYPVDIDGDGLTDLAVLRNGGNVLLRGVGDWSSETFGPFPRGSQRMTKPPLGSACSIS